MSEPTGPWDEIEQLLDELEEQSTTPDPWNEVDVGDAALTDAQVAFLAGLDDQPPVPRLDEPSPGT